MHDALPCGQENRGISGRIWTRLDMYIVNLSKKRFTNSLSYLRNCIFYILIFDSFFQVMGTQNYLGIGLYTVPCSPMGGWTSTSDNLSYYMTWCRRSRFTGVYSPRRSVITKSYSFKSFVRINSLVGPVLQCGHPGREYARE